MTDADLQQRDDDRLCPRLKVVVAGTGRDGTMTMARLLSDLSEANAEAMVVEHELYANHICNLLSHYYETGYRFYLQVVKDLVANLPAHGVSGTTYQFALDIMADVYGPSVKLIHLKRKDKAQFIESLARIIYYRPAMAINMTTEKCRDDLDETTFRLAAFHYGEMTRSAWEALTLEQRLSWHYDKTHALIEKAKSRFKAHLMVYTEDLGSDRTIDRVARFINPAWDKRCPPVHLNARASWEQKKAKNEAIRSDMLRRPNGGPSSRSRPK